VALQQIIGFRTEDHWQIFPTDSGIGDAPEEHPTSYIRNVLNIAALRLLGNGHLDLVNEIEDRFEALRPQAQHITWRLLDAVQVAEVPIKEMARSAEIAAELIVPQNLQALGGKSYRDLGDFAADDQVIVDKMIDPLVEGDPTFAQVQGATPRHALAATVFAFEKDRSRATAINQTFQFFV